MKFLVFSHSSELYGAERSIFELCTELKRQGHKIVFSLPSKGKFYEKLKEIGFDVIINPNPQWICLPREKDYSRYFYLKHRIKLLLYFFRNSFFALQTIKKLISENEPDCVMVNTTTIPLPIIGGWQKKKQVVVFARESIFSKSLSFKFLFPNIILKLIFLLPKKIIVPSHYLKKYFFGFFKKEKMCVLSNPIKLVDSTERKFPVFASNFKIGVVGYFSPGKGQMEVVESFLRLNDRSYFSLELIGETVGKYYEELIEIAHPGHERIFFRNFEVSQTNLFDRFDILVNNGRDETFGRTIVEAMRMRKLVFGKRSGAIPEIINHGLNGFLFNNPDEVFEILLDYKNNNKEKELEEIIEAGYLSSFNFDPERIAKEYLNILQ